MEKDSSDLREAGVLVSMPAAWRFGWCDLQKGSGAQFGLPPVFMGWVLFCTPLSRPGELKNRLCAQDWRESIAVVKEQRQTFLWHYSP